MRVFLILTASIVLLSCRGQEKKSMDNNPFAKKVTTQGEKIREDFSTVYGQTIYSDSARQGKNKIDCEIHFQSTYKVSLCAIDYREFIQDDIYAFVQISDDTFDYRDTLNLKSKVYSSGHGKISIDIYKEFAYLAWISENSEKGILSELHFKVINLKTRKSGFETVLYSQKWGIDRLSLIFNPFTNSILISYNDLSKPDSKYLYMGSFAIKDLSKSSTEFEPIPILSQDDSEKRFPKFIRTSTAVYLYHTSGDTWGMMAHRGQQGIGISVIDKDNLPSDYRTLSDKNTINEEILIIKDTVYYQHVIGKNNGDFELKQIALSDLQSLE